MRFFLPLLCLMLMPFTLFSAPLGEELKPYWGIYRGFAPTDESAVKRGEIELSINEQGFTIRMATGLKILSETLSWELLEGITQFAKDTEPFSRSVHEFVEDSVILTIAGGNSFIFSKLKTDKPLSSEFMELVGAMGAITFPAVIILQGEISAIFGPTVLYSEQQVAHGHFLNHVKQLDPKQDGIIPSLANDGKAGKPLTCPLTLEQ